MLSDLRSAVRLLAHQPRFTIVASLTLALGVCAVTAIFSVVNGVLLQPLPFPHADRLVNVWSHAPKLGYDEFPLSPDLYFFYDRHNQVFEDMTLFQRRRANLVREGGSPEVIDTVVTTWEYFPTLGVAFSQGRGYRADEDRPGAPAVAVVSHRLWTSRFGADPALVGRTIRLDGEPTEVVGIAPAWLDSSGSADVFQPAQMNRESPIQGNFGWNSIARLRPGVSPEDAAAHLAPLVDRMMQTMESPTYRAFITEGAYRPLVHLMKEDIVGDLKRPLWILLGTVGMLLLIACANVANLLLIRADGRQREIAVRTALGATRAALVRRLLAEALVLSCFGSALGVAIAGVTLPVLLRQAPSSIPRLDRVSLDASVMLFAVGAAIVSALLIGVVPALRYTRPQAMSALRHGGRGGTEEPARRRGRDALVVIQTAMTLVLLVGSGLLLRSFSRLAATDLGFDPHGVMTFRVALPGRDYRDAGSVAAFEKQLLEKLAALPGVESVGAVSVLPVENAAPGTALEIETQPIAPGQLPPMLHYKTAARGYFSTMRIPLLRGRDFEERDSRDDARTIIVNQALANQYWPGADPIGKRLRRSGGDGPERAPWFTVVGVVGTERQDGLRRPLRALVYYPLGGAASTEAPGGADMRVLDYVVRGRDVTARGNELRETVWSLDRGLPVAALRTMDEVVAGSIVEFTFTMLALGIASVMALVLGAVGLYGVLSYAVTLRTREIGVRLALGASPSRVMRSVVGSGAAIAGIGLVVGVAGAAGLTRFLRGILFETEPLDVPIFIAMSAGLLLVALVASYLPARRAASVSPLESMRTD